MDNFILSTFSKILLLVSTALCKKQLKSKKKKSFPLRVGQEIDPLLVLKTLKKKKKEKQRKENV